MLPFHKFLILWAKPSFLDAFSHLYKRAGPSVRPSVRPSIPMLNMAIFKGKKSSIDIINNGTMSDDEIVASDVPLRYLLNGIANYLEERADRDVQKHLFTNADLQNKVDHG